MPKRGSKKTSNKMPEKENELVDFDLEEIDSYSDGVEDSLYAQQYAHDHHSWDD